jgi:DNA invertase Pin-like site-specific DNA recombinase
VAEFERDLIVERTLAGMRAARERGVKFGRDPVLSPEQRKAMQKERSAGASIRVLAVKYGVSGGTVQKWTVQPKKIR